MVSTAFLMTSDLKYLWGSTYVKQDTPKRIKLPISSTGWQRDSRREANLLLLKSEPNVRKCRASHGSNKKYHEQAILLLTQIFYDKY